MFGPWSRIRPPAGRLLLTADARVGDESALESQIVDRLNRDPKADGHWDMLVLAALEGEATLRDLLEKDTKPNRTTEPKGEAAASEPPTEPLGAYVKAITVEGFRGIGIEQGKEYLFSVLARGAGDRKSVV